MKPDRPLLGILLMLGFCILAPFGDSLAKFLGSRVPLIQLLLVRFAIQALLLLPLVWLTGKTLTMNRRVMRLTTIRTILHILGSAAMYMSLRFLPLADAIAIAFMMPFILLVLGKTVLHEEIGSRRIIACIVGFVGTLLVIQPSFSSVGAPALLPLFVAVIFALFILVTRQVAKDVDPMVLQSVSGIIAVPILLVMLLVGVTFDIPESTLVWPVAFDGVLLIVIGIIGTGAHLLMAWSLRFAPSTTLAPMQYLEIPIATVFGWLIFKDLPNGMAAVGIAITVGAGLYVIYREQKNAAVAARIR
ncbi:MAG: DMT family transporter [Proteobacteria bacterium]|nr:DMT family transporter [Pseudomonadota bacterium]MDA1286318.1 DMT family transporter [Pseudomonadota bacterium]